ncbi:MAG: tetratricopeptide repeat protein [Phycisphaerae bacterium]|jgi:tetratricopeptide (TPR) repeat protein
MTDVSMTALTADAGKLSATSRWLSMPGVFTLLLIAVSAAYAPSLSGGYIWTDDFNIANNPDLRGWGGLARIWLTTSSEQYFPLTFTTFWIERQVWGDWPLASRLVNIALHALTATLLWSLLRELRCPGALLAAAVFALHPLHVESVAWITERRNVLSGVFFLLALRAYLRAERTVEDAGAERTRQCRRAAWGWFALALLSKSSTVTLPAVALLVRWLETGRWTKRDLLRAAPLFLMSGAMAALVIAYESALNAASLGEHNLSRVQRVGLLGSNAWFYVLQLFWPARLSIVYERPPPPDALVALLPTGIWALLLAAVFRARRWIGRAPLVVIACFLVTLLPVSGVVPFFYLKYSLVADRFAYLPSMGVIAIAAAAICSLAKRAVGRVSLARHGQAETEIVWRVAAGLGVLLCVALGARTAQESARFRSNERLWTDAIRKSPQSWIAHAMYARTIADNPSRREEALRHYREALRFRPGEAMAHNNAGMVLLALGRVEEGQAELRTAIECNPRYVDAYLNLAALLVRQNRSGEAVALYRQALAVSPDHPLAHLGLGQTLCGRGEIVEGQRHLRRAHEIAPQLRAGGARSAAPTRP